MKSLLGSSFFVICVGALLLTASIETVRGSILFNVYNQQGSDSLDTDVLVETIAGDLKFTITIVDAANTGDLRGIFFHVADESLLSGLTATGADVGPTQTYLANSVTKTGGGGSPNINLGPFDAGIELGIGNGAGGPDDLQTAMFLLSHSSVALDESTFFASAASVTDGYVIGIRGQTVGPVGSNRNGSSKQVGGDPIPVPDPGGDPDPVVPEPASVLVWSLLGLAFYSKTARKRPSA